MERTILIGISSCLLGNAVRYDGGHRLDPALREALARVARLVPVCPEVECGLGVPREPMLLVGEPDAPRLLATASGRDHTGALAACAEARLRGLGALGIAGFVFKERSPSCGLRGVPVVDARGAAAGCGAGLFARAFVARFPRLPVEEAEALGDPALLARFIERVRAAAP